MLLCWPSTFEISISFRIQHGYQVNHAFWLAEISKKKFKETYEFVWWNCYNVEIFLILSNKLVVLFVSWKSMIDTITGQSFNITELYSKDIFKFFFSETIESKLCWNVPSMDPYKLFCFCVDQKFKMNHMEKWKVNFLRNYELELNTNYAK